MSACLEDLLAQLRAAPGLRAKADIRCVARSLGTHGHGILNGDDAAAIPDGDGYTLIAAEGMLPSFVASEPFFAGFCAVMTNVNDIAAMGGRPSAIVDVLYAGARREESEAVLAGLAAGARVFDVPLVGGHTARSQDQTYLGAAIVGRAHRLISSFALRPGDAVVACLDLRGGFRGESLNFDAVSGRDPSQLRAQTALLPRLAEAGLVHAGKDISMAGLCGTLLMLLECSGVGASLCLDEVPLPPCAAQDPARFLQAFPSFGFLLGCAPSAAVEVVRRAQGLGLSAAVVARAERGSALELRLGDQRGIFWDWDETPLMGFGPRGAMHA